jgi:radical SAM protein (TIGR01212 family)
MKKKGGKPMRYDKNKTKKDPLLTETGETLRINTVGRYLKQHFGHKVVKLSLDAGFTCPNRDGTLGTDGCLFCGSHAGGDFASTIEEQIELLSDKWPGAGYLAYFQNHTNTYAPVEVLREKYCRALSAPDIEGIVIATRPDCLPEDVLDLLEEIHREHFLWVELGLQTANNKTAALLNRGYPLSVYDDAMSQLRARGLRTVTHLILGLPGETKHDMMDSAAHVAASGAWGIKLHLLNVVKGARLAEVMPDYIPFASIDEYISLVCDILEILPPDMIIHRLTGDTPRRDLIAPEWSYRKRTILNGITAELRRRESWQGARR